MSVALLHHLHGNLIGSTEAISDQLSAISARKVYTAFGELIYEGGVGVPPASTRYGYAGAWGYQLGAWDSLPGVCDTGIGSQFCDPVAELGWLHVGHRYYDPASGRFVQRDPIGIDGDLNVYAYTANLPTMRVDPDGKYWLVKLERAVKGLRPHISSGATWGLDKMQRAGQWGLDKTLRAGQWVGNTCVAEWNATKYGAQKTWQDAKQVWPYVKRGAKWLGAAAAAGATWDGIKKIWAWF